MKAYILLCFFLLFYSINSHTKDNNQKQCGNYRVRCRRACIDVHITRKYDCELRCEKDYYKCLALNGN